jgi:hypothetical protein
LSHLVEKRRNALRFVECGRASYTINKAVSISVRTAKPRKNFVSERVYYFYFVIVSVSDKDYIFLWDKMHSKRVLEFGICLHSIPVAKAVQVFWV